MNIVYYLGAGASANSIPTINGIRDRVLDLAKFLTKYLEKNLNEAGFAALDNGIKTNQIALELIIEELHWLYVNSEYHQTIDTLAKKLFLQESNELKKLKRALITYFYFEQTMKFNFCNEKINDFNGYSNLLDKRYDSLFANIIQRKNGKLEIQNNIKIISWNYDLQIELAMINYYDSCINDRWFQVANAKISTSIIVN
jgi:hypothetical protein